MKKENKKIIMGRWFSKVEEDELTIKSILKHRDGAPSIACFLSQQMAEKSLKMLVMFFDIELEKIHDLKKLISLLEKKLTYRKKLTKGLRC